MVLIRNISNVLRKTEDNKVRKNSLKWIKRVGAIVLAILVCMLPCFKESVFATEVEGLPIIVVEKYQVTNDKIVPGEISTLTLFLKNCSKTMDAKNIIVDITNPQGVLPVYGTVSQVYVDKIAAGETKEVSVDYLAEKNLDTTFVDFSVTMVVNSAAANYVSVRVPAGMDVPISIISEKFPETVMVGEKVTASLTFEVLGEETVKRVAHIVSVGGEPIGTGNVGTVTPGATRTQNTVVSFDRPGEYLVEIAVEYMDKTEQIQTYVVGTKKISVVESVEDGKNTAFGNDDLEDEGMHKSLILGLAGVGILAVLVVVILLRRKK